MCKDENNQLNAEGCKLKRGYTTGTCAAAAAKAATLMLFGTDVETISINTPKGISLTLEILDGYKGVDKASCAVKKHSGDDPDITDGILIYAEAMCFESDSLEIVVDGGKGVGRVTMPGLACEIGKPAINPTPLRMIRAEVEKILTEQRYEGGVRIIISIPKGEELALRTYNPRLGIEGGLSILGTSGIVEPMSEQALIDTIKVEMNVRKAAGAEYLVITPGNYGENFLKEYFPNRDFYSVKSSNFIGEALDYAEESGFKGILFVGHIGKLVKLAGGIMNTHSKYADGRMEIMAAHAARFGATPQLIEKILNSVTVDNAYEAIYGENRELWDLTVESLMSKIEFHLHHRTHGTMGVGAIMFSNKYGYLGKTQQADDILSEL